jgi:hypothetical protein
MSEQMVRLEAVGYNPEWAAFVARAEVIEGPVRLVYPVQFRAPLAPDTCTALVARTCGCAGYRIARPRHGPPERPPRKRFETNTISP